MTLALDSSIVVDLDRRRLSTIKRLEELKESYIGTPSLPYMGYVELLIGLEKKSKQNKEEALQDLEQFHLLLPTKSGARTLARLKQKYADLGRPLSFSDMFIAAQVIDEGLVLVTKDHDFKQIEELETIFL